MKPPPTLHLLRPLLLLLLIAQATAFLPFLRPPSSGAAPPNLSFRPGLPTDATLIRQSMQEARMNPTFLNPANFIVAEQAAQGKGKKTGGIPAIVGFGQVRPIVLTNERVWELASVYVLPQARGQGVGSRIVAKLVQDFKQTSKDNTAAAAAAAAAVSQRRLVLLTLADTAPLYTPHGFTVLPDPVCAQPPLPLLSVLEYLAGGVVARLSRGPGTKLVCMELLTEEGGREGGGAKGTAAGAGRRR